MNNQECKYFEVVITAGGTQEQIDDVRYIGNFATGELGVSMAEAFAKRGASVLLLAPDTVIERFGVPKGVVHRLFTSAESLEAQFRMVLGTKLILHSAAVSDYTPERTKGKISSDKDELVLRLKRTPKILPQLRAYFGEDTTICGFKLLSNVPESELIDVATDQIQKAKTNYCIANDLKNHGNNRLIHIVSSDGSYKTHTGAVSEVAVQIVSFLETKGENYGK